MAYEDNDALVDAVEAGASSYLDGGQRDPRVIAALRSVDRASFIPTEERFRAYADEPVHIGWGQTCSQPSMVAFMLDRLDLDAGMRVLEVGAGCGYAAAVAACLVGPSGSVVACEIVGDLAELCRFNTARWSDVIEVVEGDGSLGLPGRGPYDRIFLSAGVAGHLFRERPLMDCLKPRGILLYPESVGSLHWIRKGEGWNEKRSWWGVAFVALRGANS